MAGSFAVDISRFVAKAKGNTTLVVRKISLDVFKRVIMRTPVDTGRARGNWQTAVGSFATGETERTDKGGGSTVQAAAAVIQGYEPGPDALTITNNVPYIIPLEYGRDDGKPGSKQAPQGMVRVTLAEFQGIVNRAAGEVRGGG